jgi:hypothetical protein
MRRGSSRTKNTEPVPQNSSVNDEALAATTDDENATAEPSEKLWQIYEMDVKKRAVDLNANATVEHNVKLPGKISGTPRQIDVLVTGIVSGEKIEIAIECKKYSKKIGIGKVDEFAGKLEDIGVDRGILYSFEGVTAPAFARAEGASQPRITLGDLKGPTPVLPDWQRIVPEIKFPKFGDCPNVNCGLGDIDWNEWQQDSGEVIEAGTCTACGVDAVLCPLPCGEKTAFIFSKQKCDACERFYEFEQDRDGTFGAVIAL